MKPRLVLLLVALLAALSVWVGGAPPAAQAAPTPPPPTLPGVLQELVDAAPPENAPRLYPLSAFVNQASDLGELDCDCVVWLDHRGVSNYWGLSAGGEYKPIFGLPGARNFLGLATGGDGKALFAWLREDLAMLDWSRMEWEFIDWAPGDALKDVVADDLGHYLYARTEEDYGLNDRPVNPDGTWVFWELYGDVAVPEKGERIVIDSTGTWYWLEPYDILDARGDYMGTGHRLMRDQFEDDTFDEPAGWDLPAAEVEQMGITADGRQVWLVLRTGEFWLDGRQWPAGPVVERGITSVLSDPNEPERIYVGTEAGLFVHLNLDAGWKAARGEGQAARVNDILYHPQWKTPLIATDSGIYFVVLPAEAAPTATPSPSPTATLTPTATPPAIVRFYRENSEKGWFWPVTALGGFVATYLLGMAALLLWAWRGGSAIFARSWLSQAAAKPLLITPGLGRWALFLGYRRRLLQRRELQRAGNDYFGLPARGPDGLEIRPSADGANLHEAIFQALGAQTPVIVSGRGGAGKSTLAARLAWLALQSQPPDALKGLRPVLVTPYYYEGDLTAAIAAVLRERDGVAVDATMMAAQLGAGGYLILFDGVSEVEGDKQEALRAILRVAQNADYHGCRFVLTTRPPADMPPDAPIFELQPLTPENVLDLLQRYALSREQESQVKRQLELFGGKLLEPLLFAMMLAQSEGGQVSRSRAQLYESYFRRLVQAGENDALWKGWLMVLEALARWLVVDTGRRGAGMAHEPLVDRINAEKLVERARNYYRLPTKDALDILSQLNSAGILEAGRRWRFRHDTFEEYFAASALVSAFLREDKLPDLAAWTGLEAQQGGFLGVIEFSAEMLDAESRRALAALDLPEPWREVLLGGV